MGIALHLTLILFFICLEAMILLQNFFNKKKGYVSVITELELIGYQHITAKEQSQIIRFLEDCTINY